MNWFTRNNTLPRRIKATLAPERRFAADAKKRYLSLYDAAHGGAAGHGVGWRVAWRSAGAAAAILATVAATSAFADVRNVPPTNMLYPLKRLAESVQLAVAPAAAKPTLELSFAARRAEEINAIAANPDAAAYAPLVKKLTKNLDAEVSSSLADEARTPLKGEALLKFCSFMGPAFSEEQATATATSSATVTSTPPFLLSGEGNGRDEQVSVGERVAANQGLFARVAGDCPSLMPGGATTSVGEGHGSFPHGRGSVYLPQDTPSGSASFSAPSIVPAGDVSSGASGNDGASGKDGGDGGRHSFSGFSGR